MDISDIYKEHRTAVGRMVKNSIFIKSLRPSEENSASFSSTPSGNVLHNDYMHNPLSSEYFYKKH